MKIITCASFYGSGSSALTNLVSEYKTVKDMSDFEFRFLYDLDGVSDLEFHLCQCHDRHNAGHAIKRFKKLSKFNSGNIINKRYEPFFNNNYMKITNDYIDSLTKFSFNGWWFYDLYDKGITKYYVLMTLNKIIRKLSNKKYSILNKEIIYCSHPSEEEFLKATRNYVSKLLREANTEKLPYLEIDQIVSSQNINRILRYFSDDIFVFVVDRDPRDIYVLNRFYWKEHICPKDVELFCDWFIYTRESGPKEEDNKNVFRIKFEDLIYDYEKTVSFIEKVTGLSHLDHIKKYSKLNPKLSINNTQVWKKHNIDKEIEIIEKRLSKYLYPFEKTKNNVICGLDNNNNNVF